MNEVDKILKDAAKIAVISHLRTRSDAYRGA